MIDVLQPSSALEERKDRRNQRILKESGFGKKRFLLQIAQAISIVPSGSKEKKLLEGFLSARTEFRRHRRSRAMRLFEWKSFHYSRMADTASSKVSSLWMIRSRFVGNLPRKSHSRNTEIPNCHRDRHTQKVSIICLRPVPNEAERNGGDARNQIQTPSGWERLWR